MEPEADQVPMVRKDGIRTLGRKPLIAAVEGDSETVAVVIRETPVARSGERRGRVTDGYVAGSTGKNCREGAS